MSQDPDSLKPAFDRLEGLVVAASHLQDPADLELLLPAVSRLVGEIEEEAKRRAPRTQAGEKIVRVRDALKDAVHARNGKRYVQECEEAEANLVRAAGIMGIDVGE